LAVILPRNVSVHLQHHANGAKTGTNLVPRTADPALRSTPLREHRLHHRLSPDELATRIGVHPTTVLRWERGDRLPGPSHLKALAGELGLETAEVAGFFDAFRTSTPRAPTNALPARSLRVLRHRAQVPAVRLAETVGVPPATVYNWEAGRARLPLEHLPKLARVLRLDLDALRDLIARPPAKAARRPPGPLRRMRHRTGLTQAVVARRIGTSRHLVGSWERGEQRPPLSAVRRLAGVYGMPVSAVARAAGVRPPELLDPRSWSPGDFPAALRVLRQWSGLRQRDVAERCGCSVAAVRAWEAGRGVPLPARRRRLEEIFGLRPDALVRALPR
jgi:transcriptional regulator with XRE-family HTH domain